MCADGENVFKDRAILIVISVSVILLILVIAIVLVSITCLVRWKKKSQVELDREERIYDMPHILLDSSISGTGPDNVNMAYGHDSISESGSDEIKPNVAYSIPGTANNIDDVKLQPCMAYSKGSISGTAYVNLM